MIELSSGNSSSSFPSMSLVNSPSRTLCSPPATNNANGLLATRPAKFPCPEIDKLKQKYRLQHTSCLTHLQSLIHKHRVALLFPLSLSSGWPQSSLSRFPNVVIVPRTVAVECVWNVPRASVDLMLNNTRVSVRIPWRWTSNDCSFSVMSVLMFNTMPSSSEHDGRFSPPLSNRRASEVNQRNISSHTEGLTD